MTMHSQDADNAILTLREAARLLRMHKEVVRRKAKKGEIPGGRLIGQRWRFSRQALINWVAIGEEVRSTT